MKGFARIGIWVVPLAFALLNTSLWQLLFLANPAWMTALMTYSSTFYVPRLIALAVVALTWLIIGWWIVVLCMKPSSLQIADQNLAKAVKG
jgi:lysylphosphatidylglycerol synthetase-like protein (DUF2156 family)